MTEATPKPEPEEQPVENTETPEADSQVADLQKQLATANDKMLRALAEAQNVRHRAERERDDMRKYAVTEFARDLLAVSDNLRRALSAITPEQCEKIPELKNIFVGVEMTERELLRVFESKGIKKIEPLGQKFDPNLHEVMFESDTPGKEPGTIVQIIEPGYTIHDRLLRPARVGVSKGDSTGTPGTTVNEEA